MITPSKQANRKKTEENINQPSIKTIPSATTYMQQIKILFSTDELSIKFKPLNCYGASRLVKDLFGFLINLVMKMFVFNSKREESPVLGAFERGIF